jgi:hypothetical protein
LIEGRRRRRGGWLWFLVKHGLKIADKNRDKNMKKSETPAVAAHILDMLLLQSKKSWKNAGATLLYIYTYIYCCIRTPETKSHQNRTKTHQNFDSDRKTEVET